MAEAWAGKLMDSRAKELVKQGGHLFQRRAPLLSLWQEMNDNFYPERADYTLTRSLGDDFASHLLTSYPLLARRELGSLISSMLRPNDKDWFNMSIARDDKIDNEGKVWLESATKLMRRAMYDRVAQFIRATKEADNDFVTIGQAIISGELNLDKNSLLYRCWHPRDVVWCEGGDGAIDQVHRKWKATAKEAAGALGAQNLHQKMRDHLDLSAGKDPYTVGAIHHVVIPSDEYDTGSGPNGKRWKTKYVSIYVDVDNEHIIKETGSNHLIYVIPRWQTVSGSQYAYSPCTVAALPDARLIQAMTLVLLEAGEKAVNPPMIATNEVVRQDINIMAGGVTWVEKDYDERLGESLRPISQDMSGIPLGFDLRNDIKETIKEAFYLNKISLPPPSNKEMTAFEIGQRVTEYVRNALPLFEPMEQDYNGAICEHTFQILWDAGAFGSGFDLPQSLRGQDVTFKFESPLHDTVEKQKGTTFLQAKAMLREAAELDPRAGAMIDGVKALRDVLHGNGTPSDWLRSEQDMDAQANQMAEQAAAQQQMVAMDAGAGVAEKLGKAAKSVGVTAA